MAFTIYVDIFVWPQEILVNFLNNYVKSLIDLSNFKLHFFFYLIDKT